MPIKDFADPYKHQQELGNFNVKRIILHPGHWAKFEPKISHLQWNQVKFDRASAQQVPSDKTGVYTLVVEPRITNHPACHFLLYVGMAGSESGFRSRFVSHLDQPRKRKPTPHIKKMVENWPNHLWFYYAELDIPSKKIKEVEDALLAAYLPSHNRTFPASVSEAVRMVFS